MGCNCKNAEKINKVLPFNVNHEKKGVLGAINSFSINFINKLIIVLLLIILTPIVIVVLIFNYLFKDKLMVILPKFLGKYLKKVKEEDE